MTERRSLDRSNLSIYLRAKDRDSDEYMGYMIDVNICGFLLLNEHELPVNNTFRVDIELPKPIDGRSQVECRAVSKRCVKSSNPSFFEIGFEIIDIHPSERFVLEKAILRYEFVVNQQAAR